MLLTKSQRETVRKCFLFEGLTAEDIDGMMEELSARRFRGGEPIYTPEEYEKALGIVTEGEVCVLKPGGAQLNVIHKGDQPLRFPIHVRCKLRHFFLGNYPLRHQFRKP